MEREYPADSRLQKMIGKSWSSWNLPEQPTEIDLRKMREAYLPPDQFKTNHQSIPLPPKYLPLFGTHPDSDFLSINKCPACGWLLKIQHANQHYLRDSRGAIVCKVSDLAIYQDKVLGKAVHPLGELIESYSSKITLRLLQPSFSQPKVSTHSLRGSSSIVDMVSKSRSGSHTSSKTDYHSHSSSSSTQYRSRSSHSSQVHTTSSSSYMSKSRSSTSTSSSSGHGSLSINSSSNLSKSSKSVKSSHSSSVSSSWSSLRSGAPSKSSSSSHKPSQSTSGSYTLSIPSEDMGQNESVEDLLMSNISHGYGGSKHVHIIATSNSSKSKAVDANYDHIKFYSDVPEKRLKLSDSSSHSRSSDHHHKSSSSHSSSADGHDGYSRSKSKHSSSSIMNGMSSSHGLSSELSKKSKSSSSSSHTKNDSGSSSSFSPSKHHLRSTASTIVTLSKPLSSISSMSSATTSSGASSSSRSSHHHLSSLGSGSSRSGDKDKDKEKDKMSSSSPKKKKRKRDKDEPRKIIPLKDRDFNPDKHCGVCTPANNTPCKRSLTCKTHSVASRRAVTGRSQSFDALLAAHKLAKTEEKNLTLKVKDTIEEPLPPPPKPKKKKPSGSMSSSGLSSPNDQPSVAIGTEPTSFARSESPAIEVISVKTTPKPPPKPASPIKMPKIAEVPQFSFKNYKTCPLIYPYQPHLQAKFEGVWNNPTTLQRPQFSMEEKSKFLFLLKHYKNPYFINVEVPKPITKNAREKRNVFSNWNPSEKPVAGPPRTYAWASVDNSTNSKRGVTDSDPPDDDIVFTGILTKTK